VKNLRELFAREHMRIQMAEGRRNLQLLERAYKQQSEREQKTSEPQRKQ
jgi:hypothetical protein